MIQQGTDYITFCSTKLKPFLIQNKPTEHPSIQPELYRLVSIVIPVKKTTVSTNTADISVFLQDDLIYNTYTFKTSRYAEVTSLIKKRTFQTINPVSIPKDICVFKSWFVDEIKNKNSTIVKKSRLVVQAYNDISK
jgi:hypothetical protein